MTNRRTLRCIAIALLFFGIVPSAFAAWYFAAVDPHGKRKLFGPYTTERDCKFVRNDEANTDRWSLVGECEEH
jgi:hypothetical protein